MTKIGDKATGGNSVVRKFHHDDAGLLRYREKYRNTGYMVSVSDWLHLYPLSSEQGFSTPRPYTPAEASEGYKRNTHTSTPKFCVPKASDIPRLVKEVIAEVPPGKRWGASGSPAELSKALESLGLTLTPDGSMQPITGDGPSAIVPHNRSRSTANAGPRASKPSTWNPLGIGRPGIQTPPARPVAQISKSLGATATFASNSFVYFIEARYEGKSIAVKIGTAKKPRHRLRAMQGACPVELRIIGCVKGGRAVKPRFSSNSQKSGCHRLGR
jgi:hypothetical protein